MPAKSKRRQAAESITIVKREERSEPAGHGGAWKVAYADFITALMAFFLLMWLMNATTEDQRKGLADYFSPTNLMSHNSSGTGQPFGGHTAFDTGSLLSDRGSVQITQGNRPILTDEDEDDTDLPTKHTPGDRPSEQRRGDTPKPVTARLERNLEQEKAQAQEKQALQQAAEEIRQAVTGDKALGDLSQHLAIDLTPKGLRVQILDSPGEPMFALGSAQPNDLTRSLLAKITPVLQKLPEPIAIDGHTDAAPYPGSVMTNWELSTSRANAARRMLVEAGMPEQRIREVTGHADHDLLLPGDPLAAANRRIAITVLRSTGPDPPAGRDGPHP